MLHDASRTWYARHGSSTPLPQPGASQARRIPVPSKRDPRAWMMSRGETWSRYQAAAAVTRASAIQPGGVASAAVQVADRSGAIARVPAAGRRRAESPTAPRSVWRASKGLVRIENLSQLVQSLARRQPDQGHGRGGDHVGLDQQHPPIADHEVQSLGAFEVPDDERSREVHSRRGCEGPSLLTAPHGHGCAGQAGEGNGCRAPERIFAAVHKRGLQPQRRGCRAARDHPTRRGADQRLRRARGSRQRAHACHPPRGQGYQQRVASPAEHQRAVTPGGRLYVGPNSGNGAGQESHRRHTRQPGYLGTWHAVRRSLAPHRGRRRQDHRGPSPRRPSSDDPVRVVWPGEDHPRQRGQEHQRVSGQSHCDLQVHEGARRGPLWPFAPDVQTAPHRQPHKGPRRGRDGRQLHCRGNVSYADARAVAVRFSK